MRRTLLKAAVDKLRGIALSAAPSDGNIAVYNATSKLWVPQAPSGGSGIAPSSLTAPPVLSNWAWINQGGAAAADDSNIFVGGSKFTGIRVEAPVGGTDNVRFVKKAAPSAPYTITLAYLPGVVGANYFSTGFVWRQSSDGKLITVGLKFDGSFKFGNFKWNSPTSGSTSYGDIAVNWNGLVWLKLVDDNTDRKTYYSADGANWILMHSVGRTDFLTADEIGFGVHCNNATYTAAMSLVHWVQS